MVQTSTTAPSAYGLNYNSDGVETKHNIVLNLPAGASQTLTAGDWVSWSSNKVIKNATDENLPAGVCLVTVTTDATTVTNVPVLVYGITTVDCLVQDTDGSSGYDADIDVGQAVFIGGDAGTTVATGQAVVAGDGTNAVSTNQVGIALDAEDGSTTAATTSKIRVFVDVISARV